MKTSSFRRTASLSVADVRALWRFRLTLIDLKPTVTPEQDWEAFAEDFRWPGWVWRLFDGDALVGCFLQRAVPVSFEGEEILCLIPEYGFLAPEVRGGPIVPLASAALTALAIAAYPLRRKFLVGIAYPPSFIAFRRAVRPMWHAGSPDLPPWEGRLMGHLAERFAGKGGRGDGTVAMRTLPRVGPAPRSADGREIYAEYLAANPDWSQGNGLFFMHPLDAGLLGRVMWHGVERYGWRQAAEAT
jgi:hypothetical protein